MSDLVERLRAEQVLKIDKYSKTTMRRNPDGPEAADYIEMLETALAEALRERAEARAEAANLRADLRQAEARVIADVVAWLRDNAGKDADDLRRLHAGKKLTPPMTEDWYAMIQTKAGIATALETGEWKKDSPSPPPVV